MESLKIVLVCLLVLPTVLSQTTTVMVTELTDPPTTAERITPDGMTEAPTVAENTEAPTTAGPTNAPVTQAQTNAVDPGNTEAPTAPGQTDAVDPDVTDASGKTEAPTAAGQTNAVDPEQTQATEAPEATEAQEKTTIEAVEPDEVILTVTSALVSYPDDKLITIGGGALVTIAATVEIVNGSVDFIDDMKVIVYASNDQMEEVSDGVELNLEAFNLTVGDTMSFERLNATLTLDDVLCTTFTHVCVRVEPDTNAVWSIAAEGSTDRSCDEISCDSGSTRLAVSGLLMALCLIISRLSGDLSG